MNQVAEKLAALIADQQGYRVIFSGCGTSGRIAWMSARRMNHLLESAGKPRACSYLIASGDAALLIGQEQGEDDPIRAEADIAALVTQCVLFLACCICCSSLSFCRRLRCYAAGTKRILYIGITCGLSAPYVASQLLYLSEKAPSDTSVTSVLVGFNPVQMARTIPIEVR